MNYSKKRPRKEIKSLRTVPMCAYVTHNKERKKRGICKVPNPLEGGKKGWKEGKKEKKRERESKRERSFRHIPSVSSDNQSDCWGQPKDTPKDILDLNVYV